MGITGSEVHFNVFNEDEIVVGIMKIVELLYPRVSEVKQIQFIL